MSPDRQTPPDDALTGPESPPLDAVELPVADGVELLIYTPGDDRQPAETAFIPAEHDEPPTAGG